MSEFHWQAALDAAEELSFESAAAIAMDKQRPSRERYVAAGRAVSKAAGSPIADSLIRELLYESDCNLQRLGICAYEQRPISAQSISSTLWKIASTNHQNQFYALRCLAIHGDERVLSVCRSMFAEGKGSEAETVLGFLATPRARQLLHEFMNSGTASGAMRANIAISLCRCGDTTYVPLLEQRLRRVKLLEWLPMIGWYSKWERVAIAAALSVSGSAKGMAEANKIRNKGPEEERRVLQYAVDAFQERAPGPVGVASP